MDKVVERPSLPRDVMGLSQQLQQVLQQYGYVINQLITPITFTAPTLLNSWANYGAPWAVAGYYKDPLGRVHLKGLITAGTFNTTIFTLPAGYRPSENLLFQMLRNNGTSDLVQRIDVYSDGSVVQVGASGGTNNYVTLNGISFAAI